MSKEKKEETVFVSIAFDAVLHLISVVFTVKAMWDGDWTQAIFWMLFIKLK